MFQNKMAHFYGPMCSNHILFSPSLYIIFSPFHFTFCTVQWRLCVFSHMMSQEPMHSGSPNLT